MSKASVEAPRDEAELLRRARALGGLRVGELARDLGVALPTDSRRAKGTVGVLLERALGATARSRSVPDFEALGIEMKTLPVDDAGAPVESTFVCVLPAREMLELAWEASPVRRKLAHVLWVLVDSARGRAVADRRIGAAFLWKLASDTEAMLRADWEAHRDRMARDGLDALDAHSGEHLQVRPKAAHGGVRALHVDEDGDCATVLPRGFYLRTHFTHRVVREGLGWTRDRGLEPSIDPASR